MEDDHLIPVANEHDDIFYMVQMAILIRAVRSAGGWNQADMAEMSGVSKPTLQRFEQFDVSTRIGTIGKLIKIVKDAGVQFEIHQDRLAIVFPDKFIEKVVFDSKLKNRQYREK